MDGLTILQQCRGGHLIEEIAAAIKEVGDEVASTQHKGSVTLKLTLSPGPVPLSVIVEDDIDRKPPKTASGTAMFYAYEGDFYQRDPRQTVMDFRDVTSTQTELRVPEQADASAREA